MCLMMQDTEVTKLIQNNPSFLTVLLRGCACSTLKYMKAATLVYSHVVFTQTAERWGGLCTHPSNKSDISYLKNQQGLQHSDPLNSSPGSHSLLVSNSIGTTSSCSFLAFLLSISVESSRLHCLCFLVSVSNS